MLNPSPRQIAIMNEVQNGTGNIGIQAAAGAGKTTTIVMCMGYVPKGSTGVFLAFNKAIAIELEKRAPSNVKASTLNSLGYSVCRTGIKGYIKIDENKSSNLFRFNILKIKGKDSENTTEVMQYYYISKFPLQQIVSLLKANFILKPTVKDVCDIMEQYDIKLRLKEDDKPRFYDHCIAVFSLSVKTFTVLDFDDQIVMPLIHNWTMPKYDYIFVDEAQDLSPVQQEFVRKLAE